MRKFLDIISEAERKVPSSYFVSLKRKLKGDKNIIWHETGLNAARAILVGGFKTGQELGVGESTAAVFFTPVFHRDVSYVRNEQQGAYLPACIEGLNLISSDELGRIGELSESNQKMVDAGEWTYDYAADYEGIQRMDDGYFPDGVDGAYKVRMDGKRGAYALRKDAATVALRKAIEKAERVDEKFVSGFEANRISKRLPIEVFKNPTRSEFKGCVSYDAVRAMLVDGDLYVWSFEALHAEVAAHMQFSNNAIPLVLYGSYKGEVSVEVTDFSKRTIWHHSDEVGDKIREELMDFGFTGVNVSYYDEAIVGDWCCLDDEDEDEDDLHESSPDINLTEGITQIPTEWEEMVMKQVANSVISWAMSFEKNPKIKAAIRLAQKEFGKGQKPTTDKLTVIALPPVEHYGKLPNTDQKILSVVFFGDNPHLSSHYDPVKFRLVINLKSLFYLDRWPERVGHEGDLVHAIHELQATAHHELIHAVQYLYLHDKQTARKNDYGENGAGYYTSPLEFDPQIVSALGEFKRLLKDYPVTSKDLKAFLAMRPRTNLATPHNLFKHLKATSPEKYKIAVKKFITELEKEKPAEAG